MSPSLDITYPASTSPASTSLVDVAMMTTLSIVNGVGERRAAVCTQFKELNCVWTPSPSPIIGQWRALVVHRIVLAACRTWTDTRAQCHSGRQMCTSSWETSQEWSGHGIQTTSLDRRAPIGHERKQTNKKQHTYQERNLTKKDRPQSLLCSIKVVMES